MARGTKQKGAQAARRGDAADCEYDSGDERVAIALASRRLGNKVLDASGLHKALAGARRRWHDLHLEPGDRIGIIGPNGAGKSTLLDLLAGADARRRQCAVGRHRADRLLRPAQRRSQGQYAAAGVHRKRSAADPHQRRRPVEAAQMLEWFLFPRPMQYARIGSLSGGERRRLYLLRSLIHQPNVLLLDEPTNDLDIQTLAVLEELPRPFRRLPDRRQP
jgi:ATP-binding cassette subfamily F protein uup